MWFISSFFVRNILFHVHSVGPGQACKVLCQHLSQNSDSEPLDSELDIRTRTYTIKHNDKERNERKNGKKMEGYIAFG